MVIDARHIFAKRVATWLNDSDLSTDEVTMRLSRFPDEFNEMVLQAVRALRAA